MLDVPFILPGGIWLCPESAGETASADIVEYGSAEAREASVAALTMLAVSVLRRLGVESYFALYNYGGRPVDEELSNRHILFVSQTVPVIIAQAGPRTRIGSVLPGGLKSFLGIPPEAFEVLDEAALLSLIKIQNTYDDVEALMADIAGSTPESEVERTVISMMRSMQSGICCTMAGISGPRTRRRGAPPAPPDGMYPGASGWRWRMGSCIP